MRIGDKEPSAARRCAQLRQQIRLAGCVHEDKSQIACVYRVAGRKL